MNTNKKILMEVRGLIKTMQSEGLKFYTPDEILDSVKEYIDARILPDNTNTNSWSLSKNKEFLDELPNLPTTTLARKYHVSYQAIRYHKRKLISSLCP